MSAEESFLKVPRFHRMTLCSSSTGFRTISLDCERSEPFLKQIIFFKLLLRLVQISDADTPTCQPQRTAEQEAEDKAGLEAEAAEAEAEALAEAETVALAAAKEKATLEAEATKAEVTSRG